MSRAGAGSVLFVGHAANRTGPPIYLLRLLRWLRRTHPDVEVEVLLAAGGELLPAYEALAPIHVLDLWRAVGSDEYLWGPRDGERTAAGHRSLRARLLATEAKGRLHTAAFARRRPSMVYVNSAGAMPAARLLPPTGAVRVSHVHELDVGLRYYTRPADLVSFLAADHLVVASDAVGENLRARHGVLAPLARHYETIDVDELRADHHEDRRAVRDQLGLPAGAHVVGMGGITEWRKGPDLFLRTALALRAAWTPAEPPVRFVWVGGDERAIAHWRATARRAGLDDLVCFAGHQSDPARWYAAFDVFVLTAREDAYPLACLEAAGLGVPILCFGTGGMAEFAARGGGVVAPYPDIGSLTSELVALLRDGDRRGALGERAKELARGEHDVAVAAPALWDDLTRWMASR